MSLEKCLFRSFHHLKMWLRVLYIFWIDDLKIVSRIL